MINYLIHSDGKLEYVGKPAMTTVKFNYIPADAPKESNSFTMTIRPIPAPCHHKYPCVLYIMYPN